MRDKLKLTSIFMWIFVGALVFLILSGGVMFINGRVLG